MAQHLHPRYGRDFVDEFLLAIVAGNIGGSRDKELWSAIQKRVSQARKLLLDLPSTPGRPKSDDDWDLIQIGYWLWLWCNLDEQESPTSIDFTKAMIRKAAVLVATTTPEAAKLSRVKTLTKKFQEDARRIMEIIGQDAYEATKREFKDLQQIGDVLERHGLGFDTYGSRTRKEILAKWQQERARSRKDGNTSRPTQRRNALNRATSRHGK